jgi:hypothetical protein
MLTFPSLRHHQIAYVTNDMEEALRRLDRGYGLERFFRTDTRAHRAYPNQPALDLALVRTAGTEFEVIQPLGVNDALWADPLPKDGSFALLFHHIGVTVHGTMADYERYRARLDTEAHPIVAEGAVDDDLRFIYTDERATLGHYLEHCWFSPNIMEVMTSMVPVLPARIV